MLIIVPLKIINKSLKKTIAYKMVWDVKFPYQRTTKLHYYYVDTMNSMRFTYFKLKLILI